MHLFSFLAEFWWMLLAAAIMAMATFVLVAGRGAEGGFGGRARQGWRKWQALGERVANAQARVLLTVFYFTVMAPVGLWQGLVADRLGLKRPTGGSYWVDRATRDRTLEDARRQF
jgi:hypothetical protein